jgi:hypothetical protein
MVVGAWLSIPLSGRAMSEWYVEGPDAPAGRPYALVRAALARKE